MADFVQRVAGDILRAIGIEIRQGDLIVVQRLVRVYLNGWIVADTTQFRILCPQVGLDQFCRRQKLEDGDIAGPERTASLCTGQSCIR